MHQSQFTDWLRIPFRAARKVVEPRIGGCTRTGFAPPSHNYFFRVQSAGAAATEYALLELRHGLASIPRFEFTSVGDARGCNSSPTWTLQPTRYWRCVRARYTGVRAPCLEQDRHSREARMSSKRSSATIVARHCSKGTILGAVSWS